MTNQNSRILEIDGRIVRLFHKSHADSEIRPRYKNTLASSQGEEDLMDHVKMQRSKGKNQNDKSKLKDSRNRRAYCPAVSQEPRR